MIKIKMSNRNNLRVARGWVQDLEPGPTCMRPSWGVGASSAGCRPDTKFDELWVKITELLKLFQPCPQGIELSGEYTYTALAL